MSVTSIANWCCTQIAKLCKLLPSSPSPLSLSLLLSLGPALSNAPSASAKHFPVSVQLTGCAYERVSHHIFKSVLSGSESPALLSCATGRGAVLHRSLLSHMDLFCLPVEEICVMSQPQLFRVFLRKPL